MYILDTHTFLWFLRDSKDLSSTAKEIICTQKDISISVASLWEIAIKKSLGKLDFDYSLYDIEQLCYQKDINILPIFGKDLDVIQTLENIHGDPFDRIIISQGISNSAIIITKNSVIPKYPVRTLW